ncbi:hypothetical protein FHS59_003551 [Algoriphagus iocasae]|uniref:Glycosyl transferase family 11 n=1 Tax=Algoriphagus iocasae TaxID=1836499 RepID=A0A841MZ37_9BACT|nr:O-fucosyltransferase family protein [Algoriphagus iocasae]MBB6327908.1 hypothetical protein [Algoriphagus iocasae]
MSTSSKKQDENQLVWILTTRGFGSEINNLLYSINYAKHNNIQLGVVSSFWNFKYEQGLNDYFIIEEYKDSKISFLLSIYEKFLEPLANFYKEPKFSYLAIQGLKFFQSSKDNKVIFKENLLSFFFLKTKNLLGIKYDLMIETFHKIRKFNFDQRNLDREAFNLKINEILVDFWKLTPEISKEIEEKKRKFNLESIENYATFHIRRGDKVAQATMEDRVYKVEEYIEKLNYLNSSIKTIFLMTDDYKVFLELKDVAPNFNIYTLSNPISTGHDQHTFNKNTAEKKRQLGIDLLTELEIARKSEIFIGSRGSNIFRLIEYFKLKDCFDLGDNTTEL